MSESREHSISIGGKEFNLPIFFPSISSVKSNLPIKYHIELLNFLQKYNPNFTTQFLISAFDLKQYGQEEDLKNLMNIAREQKTLIAMDSGYYEASWKESQNKWNQCDFHEIAKNYPCDIAFCFDNFEEQNEEKTVEEHASDVIKGWGKDKNSKEYCLWIPIIHSKNFGKIPQICKAVCDHADIEMIAVPDRELGDGLLFDRIETVLRIRKELNDLDRYIPLHILGTGNPTSIALYTAAGADSFDGLEWCREFIEHETGQLFHTSLADCFSSNISGSRSGLKFRDNIMLHNLWFYNKWMNNLQISSKNKEILEFCCDHLASNVFETCKKTIKRMTDEL